MARTPEPPGPPAVLTILCRQAGAALQRGWAARQGMRGSRGWGMLQGEGTAPVRILFLWLQASSRAIPSLDQWLMVAFGSGTSGPQFSYFPSSCLAPCRREPLENQVRLGAGDRRQSWAVSKVFCTSGAGRDGQGRLLAQHVGWLVSPQLTWTQTGSCKGCVLA